MSKKELLERISRTPTDGRAKRVEGPGPVPTGADAVTTRVSGRVVRRRRNESEPEPAPPVTTVRRRSVDVAQSEVEAAEPDEVGYVSPAAREAEPAREHAAEESERYEPEAEREPVQEHADSGAPSEVVEAAEPAAAEPARQPEARATEPARQESARAEAPRAAEPARAEGAREAVRAEGRAGDGTRPAREPSRGEASWKPDASSDQQPEMGLPERPRFEGLGKAVVMPPPGYDPTNPGAFRRRSPAPPPRQAVTPQPVVDDSALGRRRRVEGEGGGGDSDAQRRGRGRRATPAMGEGMNAMRRRPRRKVAGQKAASPGPKASKRRIRIDNVISVGQLAHELGIKATVVIKELMGSGRMVTVNEMLDMDTAALIASAYEYEVVNAGFQEDEYLQQVGAEQEEEGALPRPPVVTIMGHVDHGKTTLLDALRQAKVAAGEAGGITQHIGAYQVELDDQKITFIDTPGHAAFTSMRARGASITDIVVLVVAADDGVQAQTEEAIAHARAADVPIVVAVNKMDKPGVSADPIKQRLSDLGLVPEDWGGDTMFVPVSALKKQGLDELLEAILLQAEVLELSANPDRHGEGVVIEARVERGRGAVATLLVQKGTIRRGENVVLGATWGRVRAMMDHTGKQLKEAGPSTPVEIFGLSELPETGDAFSVVKNEKDARALAEHRAEEKRKASAQNQPGRRTAADLFAQAEIASRKVLPIILKADVQGSLEALRGSLQQIVVAGTELRILHSGVGDISESDITLAGANGALLVGFNVKPDAMARAAAEQQGVTPEIYNVIYAVIDRVTAQMGGLLGPQYREVRTGEAEVRQVFSISKVGKIAGCYVTDGKIARGNTARVRRGNEKVWEGRLSTLKRFKDDVREVAASYECGIGLEGFDGYEVGDVIETFAQEQIS
jgi:translation initiation factor IF-2